MFRGISFSWLNPESAQGDDAKVKVESCEKLITQNGGRILKRPGRSAQHFCLVTETDAGKITKSPKWKILNCQWIEDSVKAGDLQDTALYLLESSGAEAQTAEPSAEPVRRSQRQRNQPTPAYDENEADLELNVVEEVKVTKKRAKKSIEDQGAVEEPQVEAAVEEPAPLMVTEIRKGRAAVDRFCSVANSSHVFTDSNGDVYDAMLNQTNISQNNNKFYIIQLLQSDHTNQFFVWRRWGRVGATGQSDLEGHGSNVAGAKASFKKKFMDKTKNHWDERNDFQHVQGKYDLLQRDYGEEETKEEEDEVPEKKKAKANDAFESKLPPRVQSLISLIFDVNMMQKQMVEIGYDARRMPLGKLTKEHVLRGYEVLKQLSEELSRPQPRGVQLSHLSSRFYTIIPHDFGRVVPPVLNTRQKLKEKLEMIEALVDIQIATNIIKQEHDSLIQENPLDSYYHSLNNDIQPLDRQSREWSLLEKYVHNTHAATHSNYKLEIIDVFVVNRASESQNYIQKVEKVPELKENRMLLWHGSRLTNYVGILSQGLRIAPPEAPVTGYMFGKGVYFADMVSKSANYCCTSRQSPTGLLVLCEVALGKPVEYTESNYDAHLPVKRGEGHSTKGCGTTATKKSEWETIDDGLVVPCGHPEPQSGVQRSSLLYNEYIVYDTEQVRMRYLVQVQFKYK